MRCWRGAGEVLALALVLVLVLMLCWVLVLGPVRRRRSAFPVPAR